MAYNNYYNPAQFYTTPPQYAPTQAQNLTATASNPIVWVQGEAGAKSYLVAPNSTVQLWDSEAQTIYLKSADASGMPSIKTLDYTIRENTAPAPPEIVTDSFATVDDLNALKKQIETLTKKVKAISGKAGDNE